MDKIGIALLLLGVAFLLKYSYDQGWLSETIRVFLGGLTGAILLATGVHQRDENPGLSAVLSGGSIATFYGTIYASYELYDLIPANMALALTIGVTMLGFVLAVRQEQPALASIATIGGFATPFLMEGGPDAVALSVFAVIVTLGTSAIYLFKGWKSLLLTTAVGGFAVAGFALDAAEHSTFGAQFAALAALGAVGLATGIIPAVRAHLRDVEFGTFEQFFVIVGMLLPFGMIQIVEDAAVLHVIGASILAVVALGASQFRKSAFTYNVLAGVLAACIAGAVLAVEPLALVILGAAVAFGWGAGRDQSSLFIPCLAALNIGGFWSAAVLIEESGAQFGTPESMMLVFATGALVALGFAFDKPLLKWGSWYLATAAGMATVLTQLEGMSGNEAMVTTMWGVFALGMLIAGFIRDEGPQQALGVVTVLATAGKLLLVDLDSVDTIVRVGLFMVMGATLLVVSYLVPRWQSAAPRSAP